MDVFGHDRLIVGIDGGRYGDSPVLTVFRGEDDKVLRIVNVFFGDDAIDLYHKLIGSLPNGQTIEDIVNEIKESIEVKGKENE